MLKRNFSAYFLLLFYILMDKVIKKTFPFINLTDKIFLIQLKKLKL